MKLCLAIVILVTITCVFCGLLDDLEAVVAVQCKTFPIHQMMGSSCYYTTSTTSNYTRAAAAQMCATSGGRLATPRTADVFTAFSASGGIISQLSANGISRVHIGLYTASSSTSQVSWMVNATTAAELFSVRAAFAGKTSTTISGSATEICGYLNMPIYGILGIQLVPAQYAIDDTCTSQSAFLCQIDAFGYTFNYTKTGYYYATIPKLLSSITTSYLCGVECFRWSPGCLSFTWRNDNQCALYYEKYPAAQVNTSCGTGFQCQYYIRYY